MTDPARVIGFLDFFGGWDPSLMFVMAGAVVVYFVVFRWVRGVAPVLTTQFEIPTRRAIDLRLVLGAGLFGVGWGLAGFCPGPGLVSLGGGVPRRCGRGRDGRGMYAFAGFEWLRRRAVLPRRAAQGDCRPPV